MKDHERYEEIERMIRTLPEPDFDKRFTKDTQDIIHDHLLQYTSSYEKQKRRATTMRKIFVGFASIAALLLFAFLIKPILEDRSSSSNNHNQGQLGQEHPTVDDNKEGHEQDTIVYKNNEYGFTFSLPKSWAGYQIVKESWEGVSINQEQSNIIENGPILFIRHPEWTEVKPRQDIPIMIFTHNQWTLLQNGEFHIGAAPIGPTLLGQNKDYVFALPARYNFAFLEGYEEVENILKNQPLQTKN
ncbi:hypothetical protein [Bacillus sp. JJ1764]|uniref:hypothetical protein n=1 Tax=Bacillus sp. JJ1764 TaxID=3122964 RepID=UPI0030008269